MAERISTLPRFAYRQPGANPLRDLTKRLFDIIVSLTGLILLSPFMLIISILIKSDSPGPVIFRGERAGKNNKIFKILKFRTMHEEPESYQGPRVTAQDDPRVTPLGHWLRETKLNELPQLWNVLIGEMSLVGPRPEDPAIVAEWASEVRKEVLSVRPGITSPASVLYRNEETMLTNADVMPKYLDSILPSKLRLDQLYVRHRTFWLDLDILFWTFTVLMPRLGSYSPPEELIFWGPISRLIRRYISWFTIDTIVTFIAMGISGVFWRSFGPLNVGWPLAIGIAFGFALIFSLSGAMWGVNRISWTSTGLFDVVDLLPPVIVATLAALGINQVWGNYWVPGPLLPPALILMASALSGIGFIIVRYRSRLLAGLALRWLNISGAVKAAKERVLIVGGGEAGQLMSWLLRNGNNSGAFHLIGFIDDDLYKQGTRIQGINVLGRREDIPKLVAQHDVGVIAFAIHNITPRERAALLGICASTTAQLVVMPDVAGLLNVLINTKKIRDQKGRQSTALSSPTPCNFCLTSLSPKQLDTVLAEIETAALSNDTSTIMNHIKSLRDQIHTEGIWPENDSEREGN